MAANRWIAASLLTSMLLLGFVAWQVRDLNGRVHLSPLQEIEMQTLTTTWTSGGSSHTVTTTRGGTETVAAFVARHNETVAAAQAEYPPDE